jgi:hypothetical protein
LVVKAAGMMVPHDIRFGNPSASLMLGTKDCQSHRTRAAHVVVCIEETNERHRQMLWTVDDQEVKASLEA